jgi:perosamine synthetase
MEARANTTYRNAVERTFRFLKETRTAPELWTKAIELSDGAGYLLPVCELHAEDDGLIETLGRWREEHAHVYPTQFPVTFEGTKTWVRKRLLDAPDRILFLIVDVKGTPLGHVGFASALNDEGTLELDNLLRGSLAGHRDLARLAVEALLGWAQDCLGVEGFGLRVLASLKHVIRFDERLGFVEVERIPLKRVVEGEAISFVPTDGEPDEHFVRMEYRPGPRALGKEMILTAGPSISAREVTYVADAARHGWNRQWSSYLTRFEREFADYVGRKYAIATSSCTGALHLSLLAAGIGPGDEVIVPDITWVATANAVLYAGATPVFCDVERETWCMDPEIMRAAITDRTRAAIPVHLYGHPARMHAILPIAEAHGLKVIEDAAPSIGAECEGRRTGTFGDAAAFSFQGAKLLVTGEGGMFVTDDDELYERAKSLADQGRDPSRTFWIRELGWKYKMSNVQAALGLGQLERVEELVEMKRRIFRWYGEELHGVAGVTLAEEADYARSIYWMSSLLVESMPRDEFIAALRARNVDTRPVFPAISQYPHWPTRFMPGPTAKDVGDRGVNLPSGVCLRRDEVAYVGRTIREVLGECGRRAA